MAEGWAQTGLIPSIERDLALEKLRRLYEELWAVRPQHPQRRMPSPCRPKSP